MSEIYQALSHPVRLPASIKYGQQFFSLPLLGNPNGDNMTVRHEISSVLVRPTEETARPNVSQKRSNMGRIFLFLPVDIVVVVVVSFARLATRYTLLDEN